MKALVIGLGISGKSAVQFLQAKGYQVIGVDKQPEILRSMQGIEVFKDTDSIDLSEVELVVLSPGVAPNHPLCCQARQANIEIVGEVELAARNIRQPCVGITGTNGKTTVTLLVEHVLNHCGISAKAVGNVGIPLTKEILLPENRGKVLVLELSSFQLETLHAQILDAAVILNITLDHLDRYPSMEEYARAKIRIKDCLKPQGVLYMESRTLHKYQEFLEGKSAKSYQGEDFEKENREAAFLLCQNFSVSRKQFEKALTTFRKPPHRLEYVCDIRGVSYYNDSKGTNVDAVIRAVETISGKIVLIAGGLNKGATFFDWIAPFANKVKAICVIGQAARNIQQELSSHFSVVLCKDLEHAVDHAGKLAEPGESVLLSPGCASYDMFHNYEERGDKFKSIIEGKKEP